MTKAKTDNKKPLAIEMLMADHRKVEDLFVQYEAAKDADAVLILTDWKEFGELDLAELNRALKFPIVIDGRNMYKPEYMADHGFTYVSIGRPGNFKAQTGLPKKLLL